MNEQTPYFTDTTKGLLHRVGIRTYDSITAIDARELASEFDHLLIDADGVLQSFGNDPTEETIDWLQQAHQILRYGVAIKSNGNSAPKVGEIPSYNRGFAGIKQFPWVLKGVVERSGATMDSTIAVGDGLSDWLAYRLVGVGATALVPSIGGHPAQEAVHRSIYRPLSRAAGTIHRMAA